MDGVNGEAIHGTRPWKVFGEGRPPGGGHFNEDDGGYCARDIRFTTRDRWPRAERAMACYQKFLLVARQIFSDFLKNMLRY